MSRAIVFLALLVLSGVPVGTAVITVDDDGPADHASIQAAIIAANPGDEILVRPGRYKETLQFFEKAITLRSEQGPAVTTIYMEGEQRVIYLDGNSIIRGFTIAGGRAREGAGIYITGDTQPTIEGNIIENNTARRDGYARALGSAIAVEGTAHPVITSNVIRGNRTLGDPDGAYAHLLAHGAIIFTYETGGTVTSNLFEDNQATHTGGAVSLDLAGLSTPVVITNNTFVGNRAGPEGSNTYSVGGAIDVYDGAKCVIRNNTITGNSAAYDGGGVYFFADRIKNNIITYEYNDFQDNLPNHCAGVSEADCNDGQFFDPPLYQNPAGGVYRLRSDSLLIDRGTTTGVPAADLLGRPRSVDSDLDGSAAPDIGAYENQKEVTRLRFADDTTLRWDGSQNASLFFDLYRDLFSTLGPGPLGQCWTSSLSVTTTTDGQEPPAGEGYFYLVAGWDVGSGTLGFDGQGGERTTSDPCP